MSWAQVTVPPAANSFQDSTENQHSWLSSVSFTSWHVSRTPAQKQATGGSETQCLEAIPRSNFTLIDNPDDNIRHRSHSLWRRKVAQCSHISNEEEILESRANYPQSPSAHRPSHLTQTTKRHSRHKKPDSIQLNRPRSLTPCTRAADAKQLHKDGPREQR